MERRATTEYEARHASGLMRNGTRRGPSQTPKPYTPPATPQGKVNTTDPDSRNVKTRQAWVQGYNAQAATNERHIVIAAELTNSSADFGQLEPMIEATRRELRAASVEAALTSCWPTRVTGTPRRFRRSPPMAYRSSSRRSRGGARRRAQAARPA